MSKASRSWKEARRDSPKTLKEYRRICRSAKRRRRDRDKGNQNTLSDVFFQMQNE